MNRNSMINRLTYETVNFSSLSTQKAIDEIKKFTEENKNLTDNAFFEKFNEQFPYVGIINNTAKLLYLKKITTNTTVIKIIMLIYLIASIITGLVIVGNM